MEKNASSTVKSNTVLSVMNTLKNVLPVKVTESQLPTEKPVSSHVMFKTVSNVPMRPMSVPPASVTCMNSSKEVALCQSFVTLTTAISA